ncbi:22196_t:CDS:2 [Gigaspora rosea]|nr:22196_t:CDS:2 [Gigaspora rosea]
MTTIPTYIEKTLAKLKAQMERAGIEGTYLVFSQKVINAEGEQSQVLPVENLKREADFQRLPTSEASVKRMKVLEKSGYAKMGAVVNFALIDNSP